MAKTAWIIVLERERFQILRGGSLNAERGEPIALPDGGLADAAAPIHAALVEQGYQGEPALVALGSRCCVSVTLPIPSARHGRNRAAMAYLLEDFLPWAAEDAVVDYELVGRQALMIAAERRPLAELAAALEAAGARIDSITPLARLALAEHLTRHRRLPSRYVLLWEHADAIELWLMDGQRPIVWRHLPCSAPAIFQCLQDIWLSADAPPPIFTCGLSAELTHACATTGAHALSEDAALEEALQSQATAVLAGSREAAIEFQRELMGGARHRGLRRQFNLLQLAGLFLCLAIGVALVCRGQYEDERRRQADDEQAALCQRLFPGQPVPVGVRSRFEAEQSRLEGMRGGAQNLPATPEALELLACLWRALPADYRFQLLEIRVDRGQLYLVGRVRGHGDADRLAEAIRHVGLTASSPSTHQLQPQGVEFRVSARRDAVRTASKSKPQVTQ
jgi:hypothetical protein